MGTRIFVGNLSYESSDAALQAHFEAAGFGVRFARIITDRETGRSRGFGFVELAEASELERALRELDGSELEGRCMSLREAHERRPDGGGAGGPGGDGRPRGPRPAPSDGVLVERVGPGAPRRAHRLGSSAEPRSPRPAYAPSFQPPAAPAPAIGEPGWEGKPLEGRRGRKFDGGRPKKKGRGDDDDSDW